MGVGDLFLAAFSGAFLFWALVPPLMYALGVTEVQVAVSQDPADALPVATDAAYAWRFEQFTALGFRPAGTRYEWCWFFNPLRWRWRGLAPERWMAHLSGHTFGSFSRLTHGEPIRFGVVTFLSNGGRVRTTCPGTGLRSPVQAGSLRTELTRVEPSELLATHDEQVQDFCAAQSASPKTVTFAEAMAIETALDRRHLRALDQTNTYLFILVTFVLPALIGFGAIGYLVTHRFDGRTACLGICAGGLAFAWMRHVVFPAALTDAKIKSHDRSSA